MTPLPMVPGVRRAVVGDPSRLSDRSRRARADLPVTLVSMPFAAITSPSLQLGTLLPIARSHGFPASAHHLFLDFAARIGRPATDALAAAPWPTGDWLFAADAFGEDAADPGDRFPEDFLVPGPREDVPAPTVAPLGVDELRRLRRQVVPRFLDEMAAGWCSEGVVGFTSTFQQNTASFALARRLKAQHPALVVVFGGANFDEPMGREWLRSVPWIDYVVTGEGEVPFVDLLVSLAEGGDPAAVPGVLVRRAAQVVGDAAPAFDRVEELPVPDYDDYFERGERLGLLPPTARRSVQLPFEGSRGCWWGAKRHCTFCGLNGATMRFRAKSPAKLLDEWGHLVRRYHSFDLLSVDSILDPRFLDEVVPGIVAAGSTYRLFYEVRASLSRDEITTLRGAGVHHVQPGIESLSSPVLALMRKGTRAATNVNFLRWCRHGGMEVYWNLLWGFPGERAEHYDTQVELVPALAHLQPPIKAGPISVERFSPLFEDRASFPARYLRPVPALGYVYPSNVDLDAAAYDFEYEWDTDGPSDAHRRLAEAVGGWRARWHSAARPSLTYWSAPEMLLIEDDRPGFEAGTHTFASPLAELYVACSLKPLKAESVRDAVVPTSSTEEVSEALDGFCRRGLMMRDGNLYLALAIPGTGGRDYDADAFGGEAG